MAPTQVVNYRDQYTPKPLTDIFTPLDTDIDRRQCRRVVPMRVMALGLGRTGTASLRDALKELGFNDTYHMMSASVENPPDCLFWRDALAAKYDGDRKFGREEWDQLLGHCQSLCDWPAIAFAKELIEAYPEAKIILTTRDVDSWHKSCMKTVHWRAHDPELKMVSKWDWAAGLYQPMIFKFWTSFFKGDFEKYGKQTYNEHYAEIRKMVPPENLLEYRMGEGWGPLCEFLDVPIPDTKFPHTNDTDGFQTRCRGRNRAQMYNAAFRALVVGGSVAAGVLATGMTLHKFFGHKLLA